MAKDKVQSTRQANKSTMVKPRNDTTEHHTPDVILALRGAANVAITETLAHGAKADASGQQLAAIVMRAHVAYTTLRSNNYTPPAWDRMVGTDRKLTKPAREFMRTIKLDLLGKPATKPSRKSKTVAYTQQAIDAYNTYNARMSALDRACKLAIACGYFGGSAADYDDKLRLLMVDIRVFQPVFTKKTANQWSFEFSYSNGGKYALNGKAYTMVREIAAGEYEYGGGSLTMTNAIKTFFATPKAAITHVAKGPDNERVATYDETTRKGVITTASFDDLIIQAAKLVSGDDKVAPDPDTFRGTAGAALDKALTTLIAWRDSVKTASLNQASATVTPIKAAVA